MWYNTWIFEKGFVTLKLQKGAKQLPTKAYFKTAKEAKKALAIWTGKTKI